MNTITMSGVKKNYGSFVLDIDTLQVPTGYITGFVGRNGAGKTTTIKAIMDMITLDGGEVMIFGKHMAEAETEIKSKIGLVGDLSGYVEQCKISQVHDMMAPFYKDWDEALYQRYMSRFHIDPSKKVSELSKGQNKIFSLIMALSHRPKLLILDEPTANLDPVVRVELLDLFKELMLDEEMTIFYSTHITTDLEHAGDYIIFIDGGRICLTATMDEIRTEYCVVKGDSNLLNGETEKIFVGVQKSSTGFKGLCQSYKLAKETFGQEAVYDSATIEDVLVYMVKGGRGDA